MWALLLKYVVMIRAGPQIAIQASIRPGVVMLRVNK